MSEQIPLFRAARLVGVSRSTLQKHIHEEGINTFEGNVKLTDLATLYPKCELSHDSEFDRVQNIKATAFSKRVRERVLPDPEVLITRLNEFARELNTSNTQVSMYQSIVSQIIDRLKSIEQSPAQNNAIQTLINDINISLADINQIEEAEKNLLTQDSILRIMAAHIKIQPSNHEYWLEGNTSLLEAGVQSGLSLNYGCTNGNCGLCKARLINGNVQKIRNHDYVLSEAEKSMNYFLMCSNTAVSDLVIEALEAKDENDIPRQEIITKVKKLDKLNDNVIELHLQTPRIQRLRFLAGQSVSLTLPGGESVEFPVASCPCDDRNLMFHIKVNDKDIGQLISNTLNKNDEIMIEGPYGDFLLDEDSGHNQIYIAFDTGFAPIKSLIEHAMALDESASMLLYRVADKKEDLYLENLCRSWSDAIENFHYTPIINSDPVKTILKDTKNTKLRNFVIYIAGNDQQSNKTKEQLLESGFSDSQINIKQIA